MLVVHSVSVMNRGVGDNAIFGIVPSTKGILFRCDSTCVIDMNIDLTHTYH